MWSTALPAMRRSSRAWMASCGVAPARLEVDLRCRARRRRRAARGGRGPRRRRRGARARGRRRGRGPTRRARRGTARRSGTSTSASSLRANETTVAARRDAADRGRAATRRRRPRRSTSKRSPSAFELVDDLVGAELRRGPSRARRCADTAVTCAPPRLASWTAKRPTPPEAPVTRTRRPSSGAADLERVERGQAGDGERGGLGVGDRVGQRGRGSASGRRPSRAHAPSWHEADDARALGRAAAVGARRARRRPRRPSPSTVPGWRASAGAGPRRG